LSIGERVRLTKEGAKAHPQHQQSLAVGGGAAITAVALPAALPGGITAGIDIVGAGAVIGVGAGAQAAVGAAAGAGVGKVVESFFHYPEASEVGVLVDKKKRWLGQPGFDYLVKWDEGKKQTWHLVRHPLEFSASPLVNLS
jgi:hypothetical protein